MHGSVVHLPRFRTSIYCSLSKTQTLLCFQICRPNTGLCSASILSCSTKKFSWSTKFHCMYLAEESVTWIPRNLPFRHLTPCLFVPPHSPGPHGNPAAAHTIFIRVQWRCGPGLGGLFHRQLLAFPCTLTLSLHGFSLSMNKLFPLLERNIADSLPSLLAYIFRSQTLFCGHKQIRLYFILFFLCSKTHFRFSIATWIVVIISI